MAQTGLTVGGGTGTLGKISGFGILADFLVSFFSEIPSLLMGPNWKPNFGDTPDESRSETRFPDIGKLGFRYSRLELAIIPISRSELAIIPISQLELAIITTFLLIVLSTTLPLADSPDRRLDFGDTPNRKSNFGDSPDRESDFHDIGKLGTRFR